MNESIAPPSVQTAPSSQAACFSVKAFPFENVPHDSTWCDLHGPDSEREGIQEYQAVLKAVFEQVQDLILITDNDGRVQYANPVLQRVTHYEPAEIRGLRVGAIRRQCPGESLLARLLEKLEEEEGWSGEIEGSHSDGTSICLQLLIAPVLDSHGTVTHLIATGRDITQETRLQRQLCQAQKMEALGALAGGIAHDFNNILTGVIGHAEMASIKTDVESPVQHHIMQVLNAGSRARDLVKQILAFSRQTEQEYSPVQVGIITKEALKLLRASLPTTIEIKYDISPDTGFVLADPTQIHQLLMNLCSNAAHAMRDKGGALSVSLCEVDLTPRDVEAFSGLKPGCYLKLTVGDTGHGMTAETLGRIFDPFFTTKKPGEGTGMGLSVVYGIVKSHRGAISAKSEPGLGSCFTVLLPIMNRSQQNRQQACESQFRCPGGSEHILLVDDEEALVSVGREIMQHLGYRVTGVTSSETALEIFRQQPDSFDLVVTDQTMPYMTGIELAKSLFQTRPALPIILCTGYSDIISADTAKSVGIRELLMKPYVLRDFALTIRRILDEPGNGHVAAD